MSNSTPIPKPLLSGIENDIDFYGAANVVAAVQGYAQNKSTGPNRPNRDEWVTVAMRLQGVLNALPQQEWRHGHDADKPLRVIAESELDIVAKYRLPDDPEHITAPAEIVLHRMNGEYATHWKNLQTEGFSAGNYFGDNREAALADFAARCKRGH